MEAKVVTHLCKTCGKGLSSSKAWAAHRRSHLQDAEAVKDKMAAASKTASCPVCKRGFFSMKAVAGHMRCHPERDWRGIHPPHVGPAVRPRDADHQLVDLSRALPLSWRRKERRGAGPAKLAAVADAADGLLELSQGGGGGGGECFRVSEKKKKSVGPATPPPLFEGLRRRQEKIIKVRAVSETGALLRIANGNYGFDGYYGINVNGKMVRVKGNESFLGKKKRKENASSENNSSETETDEEVDRQSGANYKTQKKIHLSGDVIVSSYNNADTLAYKCVDCEKCFPTFQALGGHRSTHNKDLSNKRKSGNGINVIAPSSRAGKSELSSNFPVLVGNEKNKFPLMNKKFCDIVAKVPKSTNVLGFDLNEMPYDAN